MKTYNQADLLTREYFYVDRTNAPMKWFNRKIIDNIYIYQIQTRMYENYHVEMTLTPLNFYKLTVYFSSDHFNNDSCYLDTL